MKKNLLLLVMFCIGAFISAQKYSFGSALKKTKYGNMAATDHIGENGFFYDGKIILNLSTNLLTIDRVPYKITKVEKSFYKNGDTKIIVNLLYRGQSDKKFIGKFLIKNESQFSNFLLSASKKYAEYYIELENFQSN